jgi:hypothetical protein
MRELGLTSDWRVSLMTYGHIAKGGLAADRAGTAALGIAPRRAAPRRRLAA